MGHLEKSPVGPAAEALSGKRLSLDHMLIGSGLSPSHVKDYMQNLKGS